MPAKSYAYIKYNWASGEFLCEHCKDSLQNEFAGKLGSNLFMLKSLEKNTQVVYPS